MKLTELKKALREAARPGDADFLKRFFKTGPGQYGEGDVFIGVRAPVFRKLAKDADELPMDDVLTLLASKYHEERTLALSILVHRFERGSEKERQEIFKIYLREKKGINNWDLVDISAPKIVGAWLLDKPREVLSELVDSKNIWDRRIAVLATLTFIRDGQFADTIQFCERLLGEKHDLMHKACGWMLREVGKRDEAVLRKFLDQHAARMPRTMLRYSIERLAPKDRQKYMAVRPLLKQTNTKLHKAS
jgi:3-methyladenine DNA glycosylase AlkD